MRRPWVPPLVALALCIAMQRAAPPAHADTPPLDTGAEIATKRGFAVGASVSTTPMNPEALFSTGVSLGYKLDRVVFGVAFELARTVGKSTGGFDMPHDSESHTNWFVVRPEVQVALVQWTPVNMELVGLAGFGIGEWSYEPISKTFEDTQSISAIHLEVRAAPGVRFWPHPSLGASLAVGMEIDSFIRSGSPRYDQLELYPDNAVSPLVDLQLLAIF